MALIYANAVNKRMNNQSTKSKKRQTSPSSFRDDCPAASAKEGGRKRSSSREGSNPRKISAYNQVKSSDTASDSQIPVQSRHRVVHRSKTSCDELSDWYGDEEAPRKRSHPGICQSASQTSNRKPTAEKRAQAKKSLIQKYNLEHGYDQHLRPCEDRRRSVSLDPDQWREQITGGSTEKQKKDGAFQKMKRKFSKWKMSGRPE